MAARAGSAALPGIALFEEDGFDVCPIKVEAQSGRLLSLLRRLCGRYGHEQGKPD